MTLRIGAHVPTERPLEEAADRGAEVVQIFLSNPQSWKKPNPRDDAEALATSPIPIYVHAPYLINPVTENNRVRIPSRRILQETCDAAAEIGAAGVVVHGGQVTGGGSMEDAFPRWVKALSALDSEVQVLIENTAGGDNAVARRLPEISRLWDAVAEFGVGFVLDTCHAWAGGEPLEELVERITAVTGGIDLVHLNDSRDEFDSHRDRHANLGEGMIPLDHLANVVATAGAPVVVETPGDAEAHKQDIDWIRSRLASS